MAQADEHLTDGYLVGKEEMKVVNSHGTTIESSTVLKVLRGDIPSHVNLSFLSHYYSVVHETPALNTARTGISVLKIEIFNIEFTVHIMPTVLYSLSGRMVLSD